LFDIVAIAHPVVAQDVAVVPELLDDSSGTHEKKAPKVFMGYNTDCG
jgi:hypothetical protein